VKPLDHPLLTDENIQPEIVRRLRAAGRNVRSVVEEGIAGASDATVLQRAYEQQRVVLTHDGDFGELAVRAGKPFVGIIRLRPGHIAPDFVWEMLTAFELEVATPFLIIVKRVEERLHIRVRSGRQLMPQQSLYFLPLPQGHGALRPGFSTVRTCVGGGGANLASAIAASPSKAGASARSVAGK